MHSHQPAPIAAVDAGCFGSDLVPEFRTVLDLD